MGKSIEFTVSTELPKKMSVAQLAVFNATGLVISNETLQGATAGYRAGRDMSAETDEIITADVCSQWPGLAEDENFQAGIALGIQEGKATL